MYKPTKRDKLYLAKWKRGKSIGFTMRSSLKAKGLIPRENGTRRVSPKYMGGDEAVPIQSVPMMQPVQIIKKSPVIQSVPILKSMRATTETVPKRNNLRAVESIMYNAPQVVMSNGNSNTMMVSESQVPELHSTRSPFSTNSNGKVQYNLKKMQNLTKNQKAKLVGYNWGIKENEGLLWKEDMAYKALRKKLKEVWEATLQREVSQLKKVFNPEEIERISTRLRNEYK